jgi:hypothetical protein
MSMIDPRAREAYLRLGYGGRQPRAVNERHEGAERGA